MDELPDLARLIERRDRNFRCNYILKRNFISTRVHAPFSFPVLNSHRDTIIRNLNALSWLFNNPMHNLDYGDFASF